MLALAIATALAGCATTPRAADATGPRPRRSPQAKAAQLTRCTTQYWEEALKLNPIQATFQGDPRYNDQLPDFGSAEYRQQTHDFTAALARRRSRTIGPDGLDGQDLLSYEIFVRDAKQSLEAEQFPDWMLPVNQIGSIASFAVQLGSGTGAQPFKTVKDYDNWLGARRQLPALFDTAIANMREGIEGRRGAAARADGEGDPAARRADQGQARGHAVLGPGQEHAGRLLRRRQGSA